MKRITHPLTKRAGLAAIGFLAAALLCAAQGAEVTASINPPSFTTTDRAQLSIHFEGVSPTTRPIPPTVEGITVQPYGQSSNVRIINGDVSRTLSLTYIVSATEPGTFQIPSFEVQAGGQTFTTNPVEFDVLAAAAIPANPSGGAAPPAGQTTADTPESTGFIRLEIPERQRDHLYVGEMAPTRIKAYFPAGARVSLTSAPRPSGQGFTLHRVSEKPEQTQEEVNGKLYTVLTWYAGISLAKEGEYPVTVSIDANMAVRQQQSGGGNRSRRSRSPFGGGLFGGNSPFDDPFFGNFFNNSGFDDFFAPMVQKEITLTSLGEPLEVRSLPSEGRPEDFTGAVGKFSLGSYRMPADAITGEPRQIRVTVNGEGNFDRMSAPLLQPSDGWKSYSPKTEFKPGDVASFSGSKTFEFNAVPQKGGEQNLTLSFSYFNPETGSYEQASSPETKLVVTGEDVVDVVAAPIATPAANADRDSVEAATDLAPLRPFSTKSQSLRPFYLSSVYWTSVGSSLVVMMVGFLIAGLRRYRNQPDRVEGRQTAKRSHHAFSQAEKAVSEQDAPAFFAAAKDALRNRLAKEWNLPPEAITLSDLRSRLPHDSPMIELFSRADAEAYSAASPRGKEDLSFWNQKLKEALI